MAYQVLARKWRPQYLENIIGQEHIVRMLSNALTRQRLHHAYLFTGTRGVGKTTLARILAKCLNCQAGVTATPCGNCFACQAIDQGKFLDLYEIDAASRTRVEDTRELLDNVFYPPAQGRYKIYLIDEVHMLSNHSFNALLKTLEEPPEQVKFLLATTDPKRLPLTILSRCLQFHLKCIPLKQIVTHLQQICITENNLSEAAALEKLARAADGSMRDALSLLDQAIAYGQGTVTLHTVNTMLGSVPQGDLVPLLFSLAAKDGKQLISQIHALSETVPDFHQVLEEMIGLLHTIALAQLVPDAFPFEKAICKLSQQLSPEDVQLYYQIALLCRRDLALSPSPRQGFEMSMLRMLAFKVTKDQPQSHPQKTAIKHPVPAKPEIKSPQTKIDPPNVSQPLKPALLQTALQTAVTLSSPPSAALMTGSLPTSVEPSAILMADWKNVLSKLELSGMAYALAYNCSVGKISENKIELILSAKHEPMLNPKLQERIQQALMRYFKKEIQLVVKITQDEISSPHKQHQKEQKEQLENATKIIMEDPHIKKIVAMYDAAIEVSFS